MPVGLSPRTEHYDVVYVCSFLKEHCACEGSAEGGNF
jgi:hypothetical protein